ncbi:hypothetical protein BYT27DRAFT_7256829 [Phlegmacium glaucopus]|nr:hypothetical protein BYT27DRAFT_7256829 [Phlegmacium glaucopus]
MDEQQSSILMAAFIESFLPSGTYAIINVQHGRALAFDEEDERLSASMHDYAWTISFLANKRWNIQGPSDVFAGMALDPEEGDDVVSAKNSVKPHQWVIKRHSGSAQFTRLLNPNFFGVFQIMIKAEHNSTLWNFRKVEKPAADEETFTVQLDSKNEKQVSYGDWVNLIRVRRVVDGVLEMQDFISARDSIDKAMTLDGSNSDSLALLSAEDAYVLIIEVFHSKNVERRDPQKLPISKDLSTDLCVITVSSIFAIFVRFTFITIHIRFHKLGFLKALLQIFEESDSGSGRTLNAIITVHTAIKVAVDLNDPGKPAPDTVNKGYNEEMDRPRPSHMDQWVEKYRAVFVVDDSHAMVIGGMWGKARDAVIQVINEVTQYDASGIDVYFLNSLLYGEAIVTREEVTQISSQIKPQGPSPIGARLEFVLNKIIDQLERAKHNSADYGQTKPVNIIVLTNSAPSDNAARAIRSSVRTLSQGLHHPNAVTIQFSQYFRHRTSWTQCLLGGNFTPDNLQKAVPGAMHPSVRAKVTCSMGSQFVYYRTYNKDGAIATKRPAYMNDPYLGHIRSKWVSPPHIAGSLRVCLSSMEDLHPDKATLFTTSSSQFALIDEMPISLKTNQILGITPEEPLALMSEVTAMAGKKPGTETLYVPPEGQSPLVPRFCTEGGASTSKASVDSEEPWVSRIDLDLIPPPISVASLMRLLTAKENITTSSQIFVNSALSPLSDAHILAEDGNGFSLYNMTV